MQLFYDLFSLNRYTTMVLELNIYITLIKHCLTIHFFRKKLEVLLHGEKRVGTAIWRIEYFRGFREGR